MTTRRFLKASLSFFTAMLMFGAAYAQPANPPHMDKMVEHHVDQVVHDVHASPEQKAKLLAIAKAAHVDLKSLHEQARAGREQGMALLSAATIDRAAIEQHRQAQIKIMDAISSRMSQAMADSAEVLTPEQRTQLAAAMKNRSEQPMGGRDGQWFDHPESMPARTAPVAK